MTTEKEKSEMSYKTLEIFCDQFGDDVYSQELLVILFEVLFIMGPNEINGED